jgi:peptidoglycan hydrolase CwlO-like protein
MRKIFLTLLFSIFTVAGFTQQVLKGPRIESYYDNSSYSYGNYLLFINPGGYISKSNITIDNLENSLKEIETVKEINTAQQRKLDEQEREINNLQNTVNMLTRKEEEMQRKFNDLQRKFDNLQKKLEELQRKIN